MANGFARRKEHSKDEIRKAAWELFSQFGMEKVSIVDIAYKAGVSQATIYNNFGSKETLVREFVTTVVEELIGRVQAVLIPIMPFKEKMEAFIHFISEMMSHGIPSEANRTVFTSSLNLLNDPEIRKIQASAQEKMADLLLALIQEGKEQGQINSNLSEDALRVYFSAFMDIFTDAQMQNRYYRNPHLVQDLGLLMIYGLCGQKQ